MPLKIPSRTPSEKFRKRLIVSLSQTLSNLQHILTYTVWRIEFVILWYFVQPNMVTLRISRI